jgi:hypothetical protein
MVVGRGEGKSNPAVEHALSLGCHCQLREAIRTDAHMHMYTLCRASSNVFLRRQKAFDAVAINLRVPMSGYNDKVRFI